MFALDNNSFVTLSPLKIMPLNEKIDLVENMTYSLGCYLISGLPEKVKFEWIYNGFKMSNSPVIHIENSQVTFKKVHRSHAGRYECKVSNDEQQFDETHTQINVKGN